MGVLFDTVINSFNFLAKYTIKELSVNGVFGCSPVKDFYAEYLLVNTVNKLEKYYVNCQ